jgi:hypothetical protein
MERYAWFREGNPFRGRVEGDPILEAAHLDLARVSFENLERGIVMRSADLPYSPREIEIARFDDLQPFSFKVNRGISIDNQKRIERRHPDSNVVLVPAGEFSSRKAADQFIREQADRTQYLIERVDDKLVVMEMKLGKIVRDEEGNVKKFKSNQDAKKAAKDKDAQPLSLNPKEKKAKQDHVVVEGISPEDAAKIKKDPTFTTFYEPRAVKATHFDAAPSPRNEQEVIPFNDVIGNGGGRGTGVGLDPKVRKDGQDMGILRSEHEGLPDDEVKGFWEEQAELRKDPARVDSALDELEDIGDEIIETEDGPITMRKAVQRLRDDFEQSDKELAAIQSCGVG